MRSKLPVSGLRFIRTWIFTVAAVCVIQHPLPGLCSQQVDPSRAITLSPFNSESNEVKQGHQPALLSNLIDVKGSPGPQIDQPTDRWDAARTPIKTALEMSHPPILGAQTTLTCKITSMEEAPGTKIQIELPPHTRVIDGKLDWQGDLSPGDGIQLAVSVSFDSEGDKAIFCRAIRKIDEYNSWGDLAALYLSVGSSQTESRFAPIPFEQQIPLGVREAPGDGLVIVPEKPSSAPSIERKTIISPPSTQPYEPSLIDSDSNSSDPEVQSYSEPASGTLNVKGRWRFHNRNDAMSSEQMLVEIVKGNTAEHLAWCFTDLQGNFSCGPFPNPGPAGVKSYFIPYVDFQGNKLVTINPDWGSTPDPVFSYKTQTTVQVFPDGTHDLGAWSVQKDARYERAYWITADLIKTYKYVWFSTKSPAGPCTAQWKIDSTDGPYYKRGENVHLAGLDPLSNTVTVHEYGHNIMFTHYGSQMPESNCPSPHYITRASHPNCAWTEGWANFLAIAVNQDPVFRWPSGASVDLETPTWGTLRWDEGETVEGRVSGALWDILDDHNEGDDQYSDGTIQHIWESFSQPKSSDFQHYWGSWQSHGLEIPGPLSSIYQNTIDYRNTGNGTKPTIADISVSPMQVDVQSAPALTISWKSTNQNRMAFYLSNETHTAPINTSISLAPSCSAVGSDGTDGCLGQNNPFTEMTVNWPIPRSLVAGRYSVKIMIWNSTNITPAEGFSQPFTLTNATPSNNKSLGSVTISGASVVNERSKTRYRAIAHFLGGSSEEVANSESVTWKENSEYAAIRKHQGLLTTRTINRNHLIGTTMLSLARITNKGISSKLEISR